MRANKLREVKARPLHLLSPPNRSQPDVQKLIRSFDDTRKGVFEDLEAEMTVRAHARHKREYLDKEHC